LLYLKAFGATAGGDSRRLELPTSKTDIEVSKSDVEKRGGKEKRSVVLYQEAGVGVVHSAVHDLAEDFDV
jgi:hypothetical protein